MARCSEATPPGAHRLDKPGRCSGDDSELDVFAAERYFNGDDALWCARSSSSFSSAFRTGTHEHDRSVVTTTAAATSSSEASWNSRSALLPEGKALAVAATAPSAEAEFRGTGSERPREKPSPSPPPSHMRRWLLGVAGCACIGSDDGEDSSSADDLCSDEVEDDKVTGIGGEKLTDAAGELLQSRTKSKELAVAEATSVRARPGRWLDDGEDFLAGRAAFSRIQLAGDGHHRRAVKSGEFSTPAFNPATIAALLHEQRRKSPDMLRPLGDTRSVLPSAQQDSAFTIVAGNTACGGVLRAAAAGGGGRSATPRWPGTTSRCDWSDDDLAAPMELGCPYPPSEASVEWSVVTAEGAASCNFSSAASGYYYSNSALRPAAGRGNRRRRCGVTNSGSLLTCMGDRAVDAVGPARSDGRSGPSIGYPDVMRRRQLGSST